MVELLKCSICGANGSRHYSCEHGDIVKLGKRTMTELKSAMKRKIPDRDRKEEDLLEAFGELSEEAKLEIGILIAKLRYRQMKRNSHQQGTGAVSGLSLILSLMEKGIL